MLKFAFLGVYTYTLYCWYSYRHAEASHKNCVKVNAKVQTWPKVQNRNKHDTCEKCCKQGSLICVHEPISLWVRFPAFVCAFGPALFLAYAKARGMG